MPKINLSQLYMNMQKEMAAKLSTGRVAFVQPGTKGDDTEANRNCDNIQNENKSEPIFYRKRVRTLLIGTDGGARIPTPDFSNFLG